MDENQKPALKRYPPAEPARRDAPKTRKQDGDFIPYTEAIKQAVIPGAVDHALRSRKPINPSARQAAIDRVDTGLILARLERNFHGCRTSPGGMPEAELTPSQLASAKLILDRTIPVLASTEQRIISDADRMTEEEILEKLREALNGDPTILRALGYEKKKAPVTAPKDEEGADQI